MSVRARMVSRGGAVAAALALVVGLAAAAVAVVATQAAWTDRTSASAGVTAGTWVVSPPPVTNGCTTVYTKTQQPVPGATCTITGTRLQHDEWNGVRDYYIELKTSVSGPGIQQLVTIDLSTISGGGAWTWSKAVTVASGGHTVTSACADLPVLRVTMPENYGQTPQLWQRLVDKSSSGKTCGEGRGT